MNKNESIIINLENYFEGGGTHWVCIYNDPKSNDIEYFDSFGLTPPGIILKYLKSSNKKGVTYNSSEIQNLNSFMCGYYCCYYIMERFNGRKPIDLLLTFDQKPTLFNEKFITNQFNKIN